MIRTAHSSAAAWAASGSTEVYVSAVSTMLEWPSISCTTFSSTPADSARLAAPGQLSAKLPLFVAMVVALSFILLNLFSAAVAFGVIVTVFQFGWLDRLVGVTHTGPITPLVPILMFAVLFGLSMDYEVFLVSRTHEEWLKLRDNNAAVRVGQAITGRTITAAAAIMVVVFSSFVITTDRTIKMIGLGMVVAILIDALLIRTVLVPAAMHIFGRLNWALPGFLDRRLPRLSLEGGEQTDQIAADRPFDPAVAP